MKLGVTGTHGMGKSTFIGGLVYFAGKNGISARLISESANSVNVLSFKSREKSQFSILGKQLLLENYENVASSDITIIDRIPLDTMVYMQNAYENGEIELDAYSLLKDFVYWYTKNKYDLIFFLRPDKTTCNCNERRFEIDKELYIHLKFLFGENYILYGDIGSINDKCVNVIEIRNFEYDLKTIFKFIIKRGDLIGSKSSFVF